MQEPFPGQSAASLLLDAYRDDEKRREHAVRWLGWIACRMDTSKSLNWWEIPAWIPGGQLVAAQRFSVLAVFVVVDAATAVVAPVMGLWLAVLQLLIGLQILLRGGRRRAMTVRLLPQVVVPRQLRRGEVGGVLRRALLLIVPVFPYLIRLWSCPAAARPVATPVSTYRADRLTCVIMGLAWAPAAVLMGWPVWLVLGVFTNGLAARLAVVTFFVLGSGVFCVLVGGGLYPRLKLTELALSAGRRERICFLRLLEDAAERGVMQQPDTGCTFYAFRDDDMQEYLAARGRAAQVCHVRERAHRSARAGIRSKVAVALSDAAVSRFTRDLGAGAGIVAGVAAGAPFGPVSIRVVLLMVFRGVLFGAMGALVVPGLLRKIAAAAHWTQVNLPGPSRKVRAAVVTVTAAAAVLLVAEAGTLLAEATAAVLPAVFVAACGTWACVLTLRKVRSMSGRWLKLTAHVPDVIAAAATAASLWVLADRALLPTLAASGLLFPAGIWGSIMAWRTMNRSDRLAVKAGADITLSLLLGAQAVLLLVWLANMLRLPPAEVTVLRAALGQAGTAADLPWWVWTGLYALLAAAGLAFARWPARLKAVIRWFWRLHLAPAAKTSRRMLTCVHIALLMIVLVGLAAPAALAPTLQRQLKAAYTVAFQREFQAEGEIAAYRQIQRQFTGATPPRPLAALVIDVHNISPPSPGDDNATATENDLAYRLGELQAAALALSSPPSLEAAESSAATQAGFNDPLHDGAELGDRLAKVGEEEKKDDAASKNTEEAGDDAAAAVASSISISLPHVSGNEVLQIVREYLSGLIEGSPLKDVFATWAEHVTRATSLDARTLVVPDSAQLEQAASDALPADTLLDPAATRALSEPPLAAAVDMANQARYFQEHTGPCSGCTAPDNTPGQPGEPHEDDPAEP
jgi:hypothetical protein